MTPATPRLRGRSGLKHDVARKLLNPSRARVTLMQHADDGWRSATWDEIAADSAAFLARHLAVDTRSVHCIAAAADGVIRGCNAAAATLLGAPADELAGTSLWVRVPLADGERLRGMVEHPSAAPEGSFLLDLLDGQGRPHTLRCRLRAEPGGFLLVGELAGATEDTLIEQLWGLNEHLVILSRENERKRMAMALMKTQLEETLAELNTACTYLKKLQEVLPVCMGCGTTRPASEGWGEVVEYLRANALLLSRAFCASCVSQRETEIQAPRR